MATNENYPKLLSRNNGRGLQSFSDIRNSLKRKAEASGRPASSHSEQSISQFEDNDELSSRCSSSQQVQVVSVLNRDSRDQESNGTSEFTLNTHNQRGRDLNHTHKCSDLFSLSQSLLRANGLIPQNGNSDNELLVEPDSGESIATQIKKSQQ